MNDVFYDQVMRSIANLSLASMRVLRIVSGSHLATPQGDLRAALEAVETELDTIVEFCGIRGSESDEFYAMFHEDNLVIVVGVLVETMLLVHQCDLVPQCEKHSTYRHDKQRLGVEIKLVRSVIASYRRFYRLSSP
jgi:hypothetical protein